jgi:hypothetical protein
MTGFSVLPPARLAGFKTIDIAWGFLHISVKMLFQQGIPVSKI